MRYQRNDVLIGIEVNVINPKFKFFSSHIEGCNAVTAPVAPDAASEPKLLIDSIQIYFNYDIAVRLMEVITNIK